MDDVRFPQNSGGEFPMPGKAFASAERDLSGGLQAGSLGGAGTGQQRPAQYSMPGILHYLQAEWSKFELAKAQWESERSELQVRT